MHASWQTDRDLSYQLIAPQYRKKIPRQHQEQLKYTIVCETNNPIDDTN